MSIQCVECAITEIYSLLVARNLLKYNLLLFIFLVLRHIALLVDSLVVARNLSLAYAWCMQGKVKRLTHAYNEKVVGFNLCY